MSPGVLQLQGVGLQDAYLTKNPQINMFKYSYFRYVNFATDIVKLSLNETANFNKKLTCQIPKRGHLLSKLYLHLKLPALPKPALDEEYVCWTDSIGHAIFDGPIELEIGGIIVDKLYPQFLDIWDEFSNSKKQLGRNLMLGKSDVYSANIQNARKDLDLLIPLEFWFTKNYNLALPLLSMYNQDVRIHFKLKGFSEVVNYNSSEPSAPYILDSHMFAEYIFLDDCILESFQQQKHTYLVEQVQYHGAELIPSSSSIYNTTLKFNNPVKEIFFACNERSKVENNNYFNYSSNTDENIITEAKLLIDGKERFEPMPEFYYRTIFPDCVHSTIPLKYVYCMPFSLKPEDNQPTGTINISRFNDVVLSFKLHYGSEKYLHIYAISYNIVTVENGMLVFEFAS